MVTLGSQQWSEFALHARAILGLPVPPIRLLRPSYSVALLGWGDGVPAFSGLDQALAPSRKARSGSLGSPNAGATAAWASPSPAATRSRRRGNAPAGSPRP